MWEGTDYASKRVTPFLLDTGKRERKQTYKADIYAAELAALEPPEAPSDEVSPPPESQDS